MLHSKAACVHASAARNNAAHQSTAVGSFFSNIMTHLRSWGPEGFTEVQPSVSLPRQCPATAITNRIARYGNTERLRTAVSGYTQPTLIQIRVRRAAAQQNFLLEALVTDGQSAQTCQPVGCRADGCGHVSSVDEKVRRALEKTLCASIIYSFTHRYLSVSLLKVLIHNFRLKL